MQEVFNLIRSVRETYYRLNDTGSSILFLWKLQIYDNTKLAVMTKLPTFCVLEKLDWQIQKEGSPAICGVNCDNTVIFMKSVVIFPISESELY